MAYIIKLKIYLSFSNRNDWSLVISGYLLIKVKLVNNIHFRAIKSIDIIEYINNIIIIVGGYD